MANGFATRLVRRDVRGGNVLDLDFGLDDGAACRFRAGQFVSVSAGRDAQGQPVRRSYSIASPSDEPHHVRLLVKILAQGGASDFFVALSVGAKVEMTGPHGFFCLEDNHAGDVVFAATGTGVAPVLPMLHELSQQPRAGRRAFFWGMRTANDLFVRDEVERACTDAGTDLHIYLSQPAAGWAGGHGRITVPLLEAAPALTSPMFYVVGNGTMIRELKAGLTKLGIDRKKQIRTEAFFD